MPVIRGRHNKTQILFDVVILDVQRDSNNQIFSGQPLSVSMEPLRALVDTGATATSITPSVADKLSLRMAGQRSVLIAGGHISLRPFYFFHVDFSYPAAVEPVSEPTGFHVLPEPVVGSELIFDHAPFDILLGMDVLSQGDLKIYKNGDFVFEF